MEGSQGPHLYVYLKLWLAVLCLLDMVDGAFKLVNVMTAHSPQHRRRQEVPHPRPGSPAHPIGGPQRRPRPVSLTLDDYVTVYPAVYRDVREAVATTDPGTRQQLPGRHSTFQLHSQ